VDGLVNDKEAKVSFKLRYVSLLSDQHCLVSSHPPNKEEVNDDKGKDKEESPDLGKDSDTENDSEFLKIGYCYFDPTSSVYQGGMYSTYFV
jgi:hypothetical protein